MNLTEIIEYFNTIPDDKWCTGALKRGDARCAMGHLCALVNVVHAPEIDTIRLVEANDKVGVGTPKENAIAYVTSLLPEIKIYITSKNLDGDEVMAEARDEDGKYLAHHLSSSILWARYDLGLDGSIRKHDVYRERYPQGYKLTWVG